MIVCHCQRISDRDIRAAVAWMRAADPETIITPGKVYHALGRRADCGGCLPLFLDIMRGCHSFAVARGGAPGDATPILSPVKGTPNARRRQGHRVSERGPQV